MTSSVSGPVPRPGILKIAPYVGGESKIPGFETVMKLASNEGALGPSPKAMAALAANAGVMHRYPDGGAVGLRQALARHWGLEADRIVCGAGSDELLMLLVKAYAGPGDEVLYSEHGFLIYPISAHGAGATPVKAPERDLHTDIDALLAAVTPRTKMVFIANPNNPTGTYLSADEITRLRAGLPASVILVIDAAYAEYVSHNDYEPGIELVRRTDNTVMTRTFSKMYALGGMRIGWAYCPPAIADVLNRLRGPFNVGTLAQNVAIAALDDVAFADTCRAHNDIWLNWTATALAAIGLDIVPSVCNFLLVKFPANPTHNADAAFDHLKRHGIIVRKVGAYGLPDYLRITIGTADEMRATVSALTIFMAHRTV